MELLNNPPVTTRVKQEGRQAGEYVHVHHHPLSNSVPDTSLYVLECSAGP